MKLSDAIEKAKQRIEEERPFCIGGSEEQTKISLILPMLYQVFGVHAGSRHLRAEYGPDGREKVDYATVSEGHATLLIECKPLGTVGNPVVYLDQLNKYFGINQCKLVCLTDGQLCHFFTDLIQEGKMDDVPCYSFDLMSLTQDDYQLLMHIRLCLSDYMSLYDLIGQFSRGRVWKRLLLDMPENALRALGVDVSSKERYEAWTRTVLGSYQSDDDNNDDNALPHSAELLAQPSDIVPVPAKMDLKTGLLYRIHRTRGASDESAYDGFIWIPNDVPQGKCYILPGTHIRPDETRCFRDSAHNRQVVLRRNAIFEQSDGLVRQVIRVNSPSFASLLITASSSFPKTPKRRISADEYFSLVPEAFNTEHACTDTDNELDWA